MAFFYLILIFVLIPLIAVIFLAGIILLIIEIVNKKKPKNAGRKFPTVCISVGVTLLVLPALIFVIGIVLRIGKGTYNSVPEHWQTAWVGDNQAADEAIKALMEAAGNGEPRYAHISASRNGDIIDAYVFTPEKGLYDNPLKAFKKRDE